MFVQLGNQLIDAFIHCNYLLTAPLVVCRTNFIEEINGKKYQDAPGWFKNWENQGMIAWVDKNNDGLMQYRAGNVFSENHHLMIKLG